MQFLNVQAPKNLFWTAINPISQKPVHLAVLSKAMGMRKSVPDMLFIYNGYPFFVEYKADKGSADKSQRELFEWMDRLKINIYIVRSIDDLLDVLKKERVI